MAKGYKANEQAFGEGDIAVYTDEVGQTCDVRVMEVWQDEYNNYGYTIEFKEALGLEPIEVMQKQLEF